MLRLIGLVVSIGLADSVNPSTIAPGLYLAMGEQPRRGLIQFTAAVFAVNFVGGALIAAGPGQALLALIPHPGHTVRYVLETAAGAAMLIAAVVLWRKRKSLARRVMPTPSKEGSSALVLGLTVSAVELPTAFPYFAVIAAVVGSGVDLSSQLLLLALYNVCFVLPLLVMILITVLFPAQAARILQRAREVLQRYWAPVLAGLALLAGVFVTFLGVTGLISGTHGTVGRVSRHLRRAVTH